MPYKIYYKTSNTPYIWILENFGSHETFFTPVKYDFTFLPLKKYFHIVKKVFILKYGQYWSIKWLMYYQLMENILWFFVSSFLKQASIFFFFRLAFGQLKDHKPHLFKT